MQLCKCRCCYKVKAGCGQTCRGFNQFKYINKSQPSNIATDCNWEWHKEQQRKKMEMWINSQRDNIHNSPDSFHGNLTWLLSMAVLAEEIDLVYEWNGIQVELTSNKHLMQEHTDRHQQRSIKSRRERKCMCFHTSWTERIKII